MGGVSTVAPRTSDQTNGTRGRRFSVPPVLVVPVLIGAIAMSLGAAFLGALVNRPSPAALPVTINGTPSATTSYSTAPPDEVQRVHDVLHDLDRWCKPGAGAGARRQLERDAGVIVSFAGRFPNSRFPIHDEFGTPLSLLLVARNELRVCSPAAAAIADRALPSKIREKLTPLSTAAGS